MSDLTTRPPDPLAILSPAEAERVRALLNSAWAPETRRAYVWGWGVWATWAEAHDKPVFPAPPGAVALWLSFVESVPTMNTVLAAIRWRHHAARAFSPTDAEEVKMAAKAVKRRLGTASHGAKSAITMDELPRLIAQIDRSTPLGQRDAALILLGWHAALRRSELAALRWNDLAKAPGGIAVTIRRSKTDQEGAGQVVGVESVGDDLCAVAALAEWRKASREGQADDGPIFRSFETNGRLTHARLSAKSVAAVVKRYGEAAGLDPRKLGGHSLRSGFVTEAYRRHAGDVEIMGTTRHKNATMLERYRREADPVAHGASRRMRDRNRTEEPK